MLQTCRALGERDPMPAVTRTARGMPVLSAGATRAVNQPSDRDVKRAAGAQDRRTGGCQNPVGGETLTDPESEDVTNARNRCARMQLRNTCRRSRTQGFALQRDALILLTRERITGEPPPSSD